MNERIQELAKQAKAFIVEPEQAKIGEVSEVSFDKYSDLEKFAELIVRECMNLVKDCYAEPESGQSLYQTTCASTIIEDYFGVEE